MTTQWQDIKTAPYSRWVMIYEPNGFNDDIDCTHWLAIKNSVGEWMDQDDVEVVNSPTHWMPLPKAPDVTT